MSMKMSMAALKKCESLSVSAGNVDHFREEKYGGAMANVYEDRKQYLKGVMKANARHLCGQWVWWQAWWWR